MKSCPSCGSAMKKCKSDGWFKCHCGTKELNGLFSARAPRKTEQAEADGDVTLPPEPSQTLVAQDVVVEKQEIWETKEFLLGLSHALKGVPKLVQPEGLDELLKGRAYVLYTKGWNFGNAIAKPLLARIEMEKD